MPIDVTTLDLTTRRFAPLTLLGVATLLSATGNGIVVVALPWLVLEQTGRATDAAIVAGAGTVPLLLASLLTGTVVDRFGRRRTALVSDALSALSVAAVPVLAATVGLSVPLLAVLAALGAVFDPAGISARESMLPAATRAAGWSLDRANSLYEANYNLAYLIGPGIGGVLIAAVGPVNTLWVTSACFVLSLVTLTFLRLEHAGRPDRSTRPASLWAGTLEGMQFVWRDRLLRTLALVDMVIVALFLPIESVLLPTYFTGMDAPARLGWVMMSVSVGGLVGALAYGAFASRLRRRTLMLVAVTVLGAATIGMAFLPSLWVLVLLGILIGLAYGPVGPIVNWAMQTRSPEHMRGRIVGVMTSTAYAAGPAGILAAGPLIDSTGVRTTFFALALPMVGVAAVCFALPVLRELDPDAESRSPYRP
ncbi:major facilitator superfamily multidrug transporter [Rhodococcus ruber BKS 20-38]|uniref:Multidrug efflux pump Tap n=1 Tax=Rhodococcus ruber BKS 20-38 TaxID=1278076 RepID=M2ZZ60_9NOCA|nr:MFS transporter [Rhodococcus ruber]EME65584.1 major facilitator superfamily multidrug transporter [Rhodococcus ruber BKS 20-38]